MKIVMISGHACIRVQKMAIALTNKGHEVHLIANKKPPYFEIHKTFTEAAKIDHYVEAIKLYSNVADIFHVHNEPSWPVTAVKEETDIPVVLDVHDSKLSVVTEEEESAGKTRIYSEEKNNFQLADGLIFPSNPLSELIRKEFNLNKPTLTLPSYVPSMFYQYNGREHLGGLAYEGNITTDEKEFEFYNHVDLAKRV